MLSTKKFAILLVAIISVVSLTACQKANANHSNVSDTEETKKTILEMEMNANYSPSDPFENGRLFCVSEDIETLDAEVYFQMDGESGIVEIKDRDADEVLWSNTWDENVSGDTVTVSLNNLQEDKEYVVRFTGTKINYAVIKVTFESELVQEKSRPSKLAIKNSGRAPERVLCLRLHGISCRTNCYNIFKKVLNIGGQKGISFYVEICYT